MFWLINYILEQIGIFYAGVGEDASTDCTGVKRENEGWCLEKEADKWTLEEKPWSTTPSIKKT